MFTIKTTNTGNFARKCLYTSIAAALITTPLTVSAAPAAEFTIGGFLRLSALYTDTDSGTISGASAARTFYLPFLTPVGPTAGADHQTLDMTARESRINFKMVKDIDGHKVTAFFEMDFLTTTEGNEIISNSSAPRMRHAFFSVDNWLFGQTWSTFMDTGALPQSVDFLGAVEGTVFIRQPQIRYTSGNFQIALENPENFTADATGASIADRDVGSVPDIAANYKFKGDWGHVRVNGLVRQITVDGGGIDESETGASIGVTGKIKVGSKDNFKFSVSTGSGMGRYTSIAMVRDAVVIGTELELVDSTAAFAAYHHAWDAKSSSNIIYSMVDIDNPTGTETSGLNESGSSITVNYLYSPVGKVKYGVMYLFGERETEAGAEGELSRIQASATYSF